MEVKFFEHKMEAAHNVCCAAEVTSRIKLPLACGLFKVITSCHAVDNRFTGGETRANLAKAELDRGIP
jgi:hypothetical protein